MISMYIKTPMTRQSAAQPPAAESPGEARSAGPATAPPAAPPAKAGGGKRIEVGRSGVHGRGVFSVVALKKNETVMEYKGEVISWKEALRRHPHDPSNPDHTFYFHIDDKNVIDGKIGGNITRGINHACTPNCEAEEIDGRIFIRTLRAIKPGTELSFDYGLTIDERYTPALKKRFECRCGTKGCRGTMLARRR